MPQAAENVNYAIGASKLFELKLTLQVWNPVQISSCCYAGQRRKGRRRLTPHDAFRYSQTSELILQSNVSSCIQTSERCNKVECWAFIASYLEIKHRSQLWQIYVSRPQGETWGGPVLLGVVVLEVHHDHGGLSRGMSIKQRMMMMMMRERMCLFLREALVTGFWVNESCIVFHQRWLENKVL